MNSSPDTDASGPASRPKIIFVAGHPRSGSTWQFNAIRLLLERAGVDLQACWIGDYQVDDPRPVHVIKIHDPKDMLVDPDLVFVTERDLAESLVSLTRMGWITVGDTASLAEQHGSVLRLRDFWRKRADHVTDYAMIKEAPVPELSAISDRLGIATDLQDLALVANELEGLSAPRSGETVDPVTQLHPGHRLSELDEAARAEVRNLQGWITAYLAGLGERADPA